MLLRRWHCSVAFPRCHVTLSIASRPQPWHTGFLSRSVRVPKCLGQEGANISHTLCLKPAFPQHNRHLVVGPVPTSNPSSTALFVPQCQWSSEWKCQRGCPSGPWKSDRAVRDHITGNEDGSFPTALEISLTPSCQCTDCLPVSSVLHLYVSEKIQTDCWRAVIINCFYWLKTISKTIL